MAEEDSAFLVSDTEDEEEMRGVEYDSDATNMSVSSGSRDFAQGNSAEENEVDIQEPESPVLGDLRLQDGVVLSQRGMDRGRTPALEEAAPVQQEVAVQHQEPVHAENADIALVSDTDSEREFLNRNMQRQRGISRRRNILGRRPARVPSFSESEEEEIRPERMNNLQEPADGRDRTPTPIPDVLTFDQPPPVSPHNPQEIPAVDLPVGDRPSSPDRLPQELQIADRLVPQAQGSNPVQQHLSNNEANLNSNAERPLDLPGNPSVSGENFSNQQSIKNNLKDTAKPPPPPPSSESDDEGQMCPICYEPWTNSGEHRLASLKCGHIFGNSCIERWLKGQKGKCPQCNAKAVKKDIRVLYVKSLKALDTAEKDRVLKELEKEKDARRKLELEHAKTKLVCDHKSILISKLQNELRMLKNSALGSGGSSSSSTSLDFPQGSEENKFKLVLYTRLDIAKDGGCRVMAYNEWLNMVVVSCPSQVSIFPGCGIRKINMLDVKTEQYIHIHQKQIRDMSFNPAKNDLLLTVGMDKLVRLTNVCTNTAVGQFMADYPLWSCCWNADQANQFFVGTAGGDVIVYDTRNTEGPIKTFKVKGSGPVVSMCYVPFSASSNFSTGGLLVARLSSCSFVVIKEEGVQDDPLLVDGPFTSVSFEKTTRHVLLSCRPGQKYPHARHIVCELQNVNISTDAAVLNQVVTANIVQSFRGGTTQTVLSRSCLITHPLQKGCILACASDESTQSIFIWDISSGNCIQNLKLRENIIDMALIKSNETAYLAFLTEKSIKAYKWVDVLS